VNIPSQFDQNCSSHSRDIMVTISDLNNGHTNGRTDRWTNGLMGQCKNIMPLLTVSGGNDVITTINNKIHLQCLLARWCKKPLN